MQDQVKQFIEGIVIGLLTLLIIYVSLTPDSHIVQNLYFVPWEKIGIK